VNTVSDTEDVSRILGVPARRRVAEMCLRGKEQFECDVFRLRGISEDFFGVVTIFNDSTKTAPLLSCSSQLADLPNDGTESAPAYSLFLPS
jgi:hypothetical protein